MVKALIFDVGGVLLRTVDTSKRDAWEDRLGLARGSLEALVHGTELNAQQERGEVPFDAFWAQVGARLGIAPDAVAGFREDFYAGDALNDALLDRIRGWRARLRTGIISNAPPSLRVSLIHRHRIAGLFDHITISGELGVRKPDPRIFAYTLDKLGVAAGEAVFVDDFVENVEGARAAGLRAVHFRDNAEATALITAELAGAAPP